MSTSVDFTGDSVNPTVGIVVPAFNESMRWEDGYWSDFVNLPSTVWRFVNDGSSDGTGSLLDALAAEYANVGVTHLPANVGKAEAVRQGLLELLTVGDLQWIGFMDADGAFRPDDVEELLATCGRVSRDADFDAVWSSRVALSGRDIQRSMRRHYLGRIVATSLSLGLGRIPYDTQSGLKLFRVTSTLRHLVQEPFQTRWLFDVETLIRFKRASGRKLRVLEVPLWHWHDIPGSKVRGTEAIRAAREVATVLRMSGSYRGSDE